MATKTQVLQQFVQLTERAYNSVYAAFKNVAYLEAAVLKPVIGDQAFVARQSPHPHVNSVEVEGALRIDKLPHKRKLEEGASRESKTGLHVLLTSLDIYKFTGSGKPDLANSFLYTSQVRLAYFTTSKSNWKPCLCVRYDFAKSHAAHPIFHAQLEDGVPDAHIRAQFDLPQIEGSLPFPAHIRLPSANVVGATALLSLAADHLSLKRFPDVLRAVRSQRLFKEDWRCECPSLDEAAPLRDMLSSRWYSANLVAS